MYNPWRRRKSIYIIHVILVLCFFDVHETCSVTDGGAINLNGVDRQLKEYVDKILSVDTYSVLPGIFIEKLDNLTSRQGDEQNNCESSRSTNTLEDYFQRKLEHYTDTHIISVNIPETSRFFGGKVATGKSSFMAGFGMGFLAFALKKLLLPVFIGAQLIKSVLIAMFLPSIIGSLGKLVGKGLSTFSGVSGASAGVNNNNQIEDFEFKDVNPYNADEMNQDFNSAEGGVSVGDAAGVATTNTQTNANTNSRFGAVNQRISYINRQSDNYYVRQQNKKTDFKVFHKIPTSSMLLTSYDPFYSPLLSRLDAVFQQLGLGDAKLPETERCRERLVCMMYANPAKYAPYSNLVSAQLSRELNELRKPASDNPEILRFFRYMKAAKDGQDDEQCLTHGGCPYLTEKQPSPAMLTTFNDINKLVQARKFT